MSCGSLGKIDQATKTRALNEDEIHGRERDGSVVLLLARLPYHCMRAWAWAWVWPADVYGGRRAYATLRVAGPGGFQSPVRPAETLSASEAQDHTAYSVLLFFFLSFYLFHPSPNTPQYSIEELPTARVATKKTSAMIIYFFNIYSKQVWPAVHCDVSRVRIDQDQSPSPSTPALGKTLIDLNPQNEKTFLLQELKKAFLLQKLMLH